MTQINSVLGPIDSSDLGFTLMHEHVMVAASGLSKSYPDLLGPNREARAIACLKKAKAAGINTLLDATTFDLGRDSELLRHVAFESGVNLINVTGWWLDVPRFMLGVGANQMADEFIRDIIEGFRGTNIKAGGLVVEATRRNNQTYHEVTDSDLRSLFCLGAEGFGRLSTQSVTLLPELARTRSRGLHPRFRRGIA